jgi:apolipoprotein D and lipocalin family protein
VSASPNPTSLAALEQRIAQAEQRVLAHDAAVQRQWDATRTHWQQRLSPMRWLAPLAGSGAVLGMVWSMLGRPMPGLRSAAAPAARGRAGAVPLSARWVNAVGLLWPLVPARFRSRISPGTAAALVSIGLPLLERVVATRLPPLQTMPFVDLPRFMGTWYEIARLPAPFEGACDGQPSAHYALRRGGVRVVNRCRSESGAERVSTGHAVVVAGSGNARLRISLWPAFLRWLPLAWVDFCIIHVDPTYRTALVGHPNRRFCWLLSRERTISPADEAQLLHIAAAQGFNVQRLRRPPPRP